MSYDAIPRCLNCLTTHEGLAGLDITNLPPCPTCGAEEWGFHINLRPTIRGVAHTVENPDVSDAVGSTSHATTIYPETAHAEISAYSPNIHVEDNLPTEVIAEALQIGITLLRPENGQWPIEVEGFGVVGHIGVGELSEGLLDSMAWAEDLAIRWEKKLRGDD